MNKLWNYSVVAAALALAACSDSDNSLPSFDNPDTLPPPAPSFTVQVVHAVSNAPEVNVNVNGNVAFAEVDYKESPIPATLDPAGTYDISVDAILPDGSGLTVIDLPGQTFDADTIYTVFAIGTVGGTGDQEIRAKIVTRSTFFVPSDTVRVTALHAAAGAPEVDIYVTAPDVDLDLVDPINAMPVAFGDDPLGPLDIDEGEYQIRITVAGSKTAIAFDSGPVTLEGGTAPIVAAVDNTNAGAGTVPGAGIPIPVSALIVSNVGVAEVLDNQHTAEVRAIHAIPDAGLVDVYINEELVPELEDFDFTQVRGPLALPGDDYNIQVAPANTMNFVINEDGDTTTLTDGVWYDVIATGAIGEMNQGLTIAVDDRRRLATAAKLRVIHGSPSTDLVDLYIVDSAVTDITDVDPFAEDIPFLFNSGYLELAEGTYNIYITPADSKTIAIPAEGITLDADGIYTAIARDPLPESMDLGLILFDDFAE